MIISKKTQYGLKSLYYLGKRSRGGPVRPAGATVRIQEIARAEDIPLRFLETILNQLKKGRFIESRRGPAGGYILLRDPENLTLGEVVRFLQGPFDPAGERTSSAHQAGVFSAVWVDLKKAVSEVLDGVTLHELIKREEEAREKGTLNFSI